MTTLRTDLIEARRRMLDATSPEGRQSAALMASATMAMIERYGSTYDFDEEERLKKRDKG